MQVAPPMTLAETLTAEWQQRLQEDCPTLKPAARTAIINWLLGEHPETLDQLDADFQAITRQAMDYRYRILRARYLEVSPEAGHRSLMKRLGSLFLIRQKIKTWVALSRDRQRTVMDVVQEVVQELLQNDRKLQRQMQWISQCTPDPRLRNALLLASLEEYCLRPVRNQPLFVYRFVNYLRRTQRGGLTQVPAGDLVRLVSEEVALDETDNPVSLFDAQAIVQYQEAQEWEERQTARVKVQREFMTYLEEQVEPLAAQWLQLYLQGCTQEAIAETLKVPIKQIYRLREKVSYHAIRVFSVKSQPELVAHWLETSLKEHNLGLTPNQWQSFWDNLTPPQQQLLTLLREGAKVETIAQQLKWKTSQVTSEWSKLYLAALDLRNQ